MIQVGIVGAGFAGRMHARAYNRIEDVRIAAIVDRNLDRAQELAQEVGGGADTQVEVIFHDPAIALVDIALPPPLHPRFVKRALEAGKHVVVEKPLALTLSAIDAMLDIAAKKDRYLMVAHILRFWPEYLAIRELLGSGELGRPLLATARRLSNLPQWSDWFSDPEVSGGAVLDLQIHDIDMLNWLFGSPRQVSAVGVQGPQGGWDHVITSLEYESLPASVEASFLMPEEFPFTAGFRVLCEGGVIEYQFRAGGASFESGDTRCDLLVHKPGLPNQPVQFEAGEAAELEIAYFVRCVREGKPPSRITPQDARLAVQTCLAARESLETGQPILLS